MDSGVGLFSIELLHSVHRIFAKVGVAIGNKDESRLARIGAEGIAFLVNCAPKIGVSTKNSLFILDLGQSLEHTFLVQLAVLHKFLILRGEDKRSFIIEGRDFIKNILDSFLSDSHLEVFMSILHIHRTRLVKDNGKFIHSLKHGRFISIGSRTKNKGQSHKSGNKVLLHNFS